MSALRVSIPRGISEKSLPLSMLGAGSVGGQAASSFHGCAHTGGSGSKTVLIAGWVVAITGCLPPAHLPCV